MGIFHRVVLGLTCCAALAAMSCKGAKSPSPSQHPVWGNADLSQIAKRLQGKSTILVNPADLVARKGRWRDPERVELDVSGDKVVVTASEGGRASGTLRVVSPCQIAVDIPGGRRKGPYTYAQNGNDQWVGTTAAGAKLGDGTWLICLYCGYVTMKAESCTYHAPKGLGFQPYPIKCGIEGSQISYEELNCMNPEKRRARKIEIVGDALLSGPLKRQPMKR